MINTEVWMPDFIQKLNNTFKERVWFVGLQGSYGRGEATETSDIDIVVILDEISPADIYAYNSMLDSMPHRELLCGFISGKNEIFHWDTADLFQFYHDTTPLSGSLSELEPLIDNAAVNRAIKIGACNIFHGCAHNMLYEKSNDILTGLYKSASFVVQAAAFKAAGIYYKHQHELRDAVSGDDRRIVDTFISLKNGGTVDFNAMSETLFTWSKNLISET